jgi:hypothetical protein
VQLDVGVEWLAAADNGWDELTTNLWTSTTPRYAMPVHAVVPDDWTRAAPRPVVTLNSPEPYYRRAEFVAFEQFRTGTASEEVPTIVAGPEIDRSLGVALERSPAAADENGALAYTLNIRNLDRNPVEHVRVVETLPQPEHVLDTHPAALMTPEGALVWQLADLQPFESRTMTVTLDGAQVTAPLNTRAAVDVETEVSVKTHVFPLALNELPPETPIEPELALPEPEPQPIVPTFEPIDPVLADDSPAPPHGGWNPFGGAVPLQNEEPITPELTGEAPVALPEQFESIVPEPVVPLVEDPVPADAIERTPEPRPVPLESAHPPRPILSVQANARNAVRTGEVLATDYRITNEGDAPAEGIVLTVFVPPELRHKHGNQVQHRIKQLLPGETHSARLLTKAATAGTAELDAVLSFDGQSEDEHTLTVRVVGSRSPTPAAPRRPR